MNQQTVSYGCEHLSKSHLGKVGMKAFIIVIIAFIARSSTLEDKQSINGEHEAQFSSHNDHAEQHQHQQLDYHYDQPHQVHQHNAVNLFEPAEQYYQQSSQQQPLEWESQKQHSPVPMHHGINHYQHDAPLHENHGVRYHYAQPQDQGYQQHQAQYHPYHHHHEQQEQLHYQHLQHFKPSWDQLKQAEVAPFPAHFQKHVPYPVAYGKNHNKPQVTEKKVPVYEGEQIHHQVYRPVQQNPPVNNKQIQVIRVPKPAAVHVDKPYPVYVEHPVYMEKPVPLQVIITKKKNNSLWG